jgi:hypothetical protein
MILSTVIPSQTTAQIDFPNSIFTFTTQATAQEAPTVEIISHQDGQEVPIGELTLEGISSDNSQTNCHVSGHIDDIAPFRNATAKGIGGENDFSRWSFTYTQNYQLVLGGLHELTAKISCPDGAAAWNSINISGVATGDSLPSENDPFERPVYEDEEDFNGERVANGNDNHNMDDFPPLNEGERYGECEERSGGLVCDIIKDDNNGGGRGDCYDEGYEDGQDHPFSQDLYDECGRSYYNGFIDGCMSVEGNTREDCDSATDA